MCERTLVTGFGAFGSVTDNPSAKLARESGRPSQVLEVAYQAADEFIAGLDLAGFDRLLLMGVASSRDHFSVELFARNWKSATKDVRGVGEAGVIEAGAPLLFESTLWTAGIASNIVASNLQVKISMDAGEYLCNYVLYRALQKFPHKKVGFLHVPPESAVSVAQQMECLQGILKAVEA